MKKNIFTLSILLLVFACNNESIPAPSISEEPDKNNIESEVVVDHEIETNVFILGDNPTISDYAEYFLETKIYNSAEEISGEGITGANDRYYYEVIDIKNGYAQVSGMYTGSYTFAVWHLANGEDLVGQTSSSCGPACDYSFNFYQVRAQLVNDVTSTIIPLVEINEHKEKMLTKLIKKHSADTNNIQLKFVLPQKGTSIEVYLSVGANEYEFPILRLDWNKEEFFIGKKYEEIPD